MSGTYEKIENREPSWPHKCELPGQINRWWNCVGIGSIWRCECGRRWLWDIHCPLFNYPSWEDIEQLARDRARADEIREKTGMSV